MSYEHGSADLGISNPFRLVGLLEALRGLLLTLPGAYLLAQVTSLVATNKIQAWCYIGVGLLLLSVGLKALAAGIFKNLRFFVGRSVPTSLAYNRSKSEQDSASSEQHSVAYQASQLEQMLIGRKNITFVEPKGWLARLLHSLFPKLTFLPFLTRNVAQRLAGALTQTLIALACFAISWFISQSGLIGAAGALLIELLALALLIYLIRVWSKAGSALSSDDGVRMADFSSARLALLLVMAVALPVALGVGGDLLLSQFDQQQLSQLLAAISALVANQGGLFHNGYFLLILLLGCGVVMPLALLVQQRANLANPVTEVSELRENWQESVHPQEIFINMDTMVMANRRYREIPNRVYRDLEPKLQQQAPEKGSFSGEMIQETQPVYQPQQHSAAFRMARLISSALGQLLLTISLLLLAYLLLQLPDYWSQLQQAWGTMVNGLSGHFRSEEAFLQAVASSVTPFWLVLVSLLNLIIGWRILRAFGRLATHLVLPFWAEMLFHSQLVYLKAEGTFSESRLSTGSGVHDSTRSENLVVRSSITTWLVVSRLTTSTFAGIGQRNLEFPRYIMEMHQDDQDRDAIISDMKRFLGERESIASIKNEKDLKATSALFEINQTSRAYQNRLASDAEAQATLAHAQSAESTD